MASQILSHPFTSYGIGVGFLVGASLILGGIFLGHSAAVIGGLCGSGGILSLSSVFTGAVKIDHYFKKVKMSLPSQAAYIPVNCDRDQWNEIRKKNPNQPVASPGIVNGDPNLIRNVTVDGYNRITRSLDDSDL